MDGLETLSEAINRLVKAGYAASFRAAKGQVQDSATKRAFDPKDFSVDHVVRLEGVTDLDEETAIFALTHKASRLKGIYIVAYGPEMETDDLVVVQALSNH